jgi:DNA-binding transcriptional regulator YiaG
MGVIMPTTIMIHDTTDIRAGRWTNIGEGKWMLGIDVSATDGNHRITLIADRPYDLAPQIGAEPENYVPAPADIRATRTAAGLTQEQAGELLYSSRRAWQSWELGINPMPQAMWELFLYKVPPAVGV